MFSGIKRLLGNITVEESNGIVHVEGVEADVMAKDIKSKFATSRINSYMFTSLDRNSFSFPSFFLPDVYHMLDLMTIGRSLKVPVRVLSKIKIKLLENTWLKNTLEEPYPKLDRSRLSELTLNPLPFQTEFFDAYDKLTGQYGLNGFLMAAAAGSGKTFTALAVAHMLDIDVVIVICPKNALEQVWEKNIQSRFKKPQTYWLSNSGKDYKGEHFLVGHYESLEHVRDLAKSLRHLNIAIILDESHNLNSDKSLRTDRFIQLCKETDSRDVLWLSGTPIKALSVEAIPLFRCIDPLFTEDVESRFRKIYKDSSGKAVDVLRNRMGQVSFIVEKKELGLKDPIFQELKVKLPHGEKYTLRKIKEAMSAFVAERHEYYNARRQEDRRLFDRGLDTYEATLRSPSEKQVFERYRNALARVIKSQGDFSAKDEMALCNRFELNTIMPTLPKEMRAEWKSVRSVIKYVALKIQGECLGRVVGGARIQCHVDMVDHIDFKAVCRSTVKKTVVFSSFTDVIRRCGDVLQASGMNPVLVYGKTSNQLSVSVNRFEKDEDVNPLVASYALLSTAVPLVMADSMILIDHPFRDYILQQAVSRIHRLDSDSQTYIYTAMLDTAEETNISSRSVDILKWSQEQIAAITGVHSPFEIKDDLEQFSISVESLDEEALKSAGLIPSFLDW